MHVRGCTSLACVFGCGPAGFLRIFAPSLRSWSAFACAGTPLSASTGFVQADAAAVSGLRQISAAPLYSYGLVCSPRCAATTEVLVRTGAERVA